MLPANEDYYTFDFDTLVCLRSEDGRSRPDIICFANRAGRIFHGLCLHIPPAVLLQTNSRPQGKVANIRKMLYFLDLQLI